MAEESGKGPAQVVTPGFSEAGSGDFGEEYAGEYAEEYETPGFDETETAKSPVSMRAAAFGEAGADKKIRSSIQIIYTLLCQHYDQQARFNVMTGKAEYYSRPRRQWLEWGKVQDAQMQAYLESTYGIYSPRKVEAAFDIFLAAHRVNPLIGLLESLEWDGRPRVHEFLHDVLKCDDNDYTRECSRLIFAGGIHRAYHPGCKFDDMIVLMGRQMSGKSTVVRWLNIDDQFFREIKTITGKEGIEALSGVWIGEMSELMAMTRVKEAEAVKAYITCQEDSYRAPYDRFVQKVPRRCIFIGTTNNFNFLTDKTGNRRFYPVMCNSDAYAIRANEDLIRNYIRQAWAEALALFRRNELQPYARKDVMEQIRTAQEDAMEDDWRIGAIQQYLEDQKRAPNSRVSVIELWHNALGEAEEIKPTRKDSIEITQIIANMPGWKKCKSTFRTPWGIQKGFIRENLYFPVWR